ncbi:lectin [Megavirus baoshan]|uniref:Putative lectin n=1 Tax=Megavirus baoshan TaxID=2496520 RepID=A0A3S8UWH0_9VIRU|nr:lectin [Megavirus baoshan]AZL89103.1 lectin [Megavirus baoshan]
MNNIAIVIIIIAIIIVILLAIGIFVTYTNKAIDTTNILTPITPTPSNFIPVSPNPTPSYGPFIPISPAPTSSLYSNSYNTLQQNERLVNGDYYMVPQSDGNLCIYDTRDAKAIWCSGSNKKGSAPYKLVLQQDGNLCMHDHNTTTWCAGSNGGTGPWKATMQKDRNFCVYDSTGRSNWCTKSQI